MTVTTNGHDHNVTDSGDVRMRVRVAENPPARPDRPDSAPGFAYTHAIPRQDPSIKDDEQGKIRNFVSLHGGEVGEALTASWVLTEAPEPLQAVAQRFTQLPGGFRHNTGHIAAGLIRLGVYALAYLMCAAVHTNKRAAATGTLTALTITATAIAAAVTHH